MTVHASGRRYEMARSHVYCVWANHKVNVVYDVGITRASNPGYQAIFDSDVCFEDTEDRINDNYSGDYVIKLASPGRSMGHLYSRPYRFATLV